MNLIDDIDGKLTKLWMFWCVRLNVLAAACSGAVATYEGFKALDPALVRHIPICIIALLAAGAVLFTFSSILARGIKQPKLGPDDNAEHA